MRHTNDLLTGLYQDENVSSQGKFASEKSCHSNLQLEEALSWLRVESQMRCGDVDVAENI
jgi:hypothetical protein